MLSANITHHCQNVKGWGSHSAETAGLHGVKLLTSGGKYAILVHLGRRLVPSGSLWPTLHLHFSYERYRNTMNKMNKRKRVLLSLSPERHALVRQVAKDAGIPMSAWVQMAINSYLGNWKDPMAKRRKQHTEEQQEYAWGWPKAQPCPQCGAKHDPSDHGWSPGDQESWLVWLRAQD